MGLPPFPACVVNLGSVTMLILCLDSVNIYISSDPKQTRYHTAMFYNIML